VIVYLLQAIKDGADAVIAVGGDGTLHEVFMCVDCLQNHAKYSWNRVDCLYNL
jgi:diacylglycerol kinase family enzyme